MNTNTNPAIQRMQAARKRLNVQNSGYSHHGASTTKKSMIGWNATSLSPAEDITSNLHLLRQRSRDLYMGGAALATSAIKTARTNVVGTGLWLEPAVDAEFLGMGPEEASSLKRQIEREYNLWAESVECDAARQNNMYQLQQLALLSQLMSGDCFVLLPVTIRKQSIYDLRVRIIEADRCRSPWNFTDRFTTEHKDKNISGGVETNDAGEVIAYWFSKNHPYSIVDYGKDDWTRVAAYGEETGRRNVLHLMESERPEQRRGVPILAPVIDSIKQLGRYTEAELMAAVVTGMFTVFIKSNTNGNQPLDLGFGDGDQVDQGDENSYELGYGSVVGLAPDEDVVLANPSRPNTAFDAFVIAICRQIGAALEIPYELLVKNFTASYSASRAALLEAWKMFRMRRSWLATGFCQPIYEEWFAEAVAKGRIPAPGFFDDPLIRRAYTKAEWHGPSQGQLDPLKEVKAAQVRVEEGFSTRERETAEMTGADFETNNTQRVREEKLRREGGLIPVALQPAGNFEPANPEESEEDDSDDK
ncbi:phage portal protein [Paenibacillus sp. NRS-1760]|uniref:phage portal protein n=1 Tax=Paenibacillus sp. NRS-1760 TaxID=3233902 RepID=UPI003D299384